MQNRNTQDYFGINLCDEIDSKLKSRVPSEIDIVLTLHVPVDNPGKYKKELTKKVEAILDKTITIGDRFKIDILAMAHSPFDEKSYKVSSGQKSKIGIYSFVRCRSG